jgi:hypothetical protein
VSWRGAAISLLLGLVIFLVCLTTARAAAPNASSNCTADVIAERGDTLFVQLACVRPK